MFWLKNALKLLEFCSENTESYVVSRTKHSIEFKLRHETQTWIYASANAFGYVRIIEMPYVNGKHFFEGFVLAPCQLESAKKKLLKQKAMRWNWMKMAEDGFIRALKIKNRAEFIKRLHKHVLDEHFNSKVPFSKMSREDQRRFKAVIALMTLKEVRDKISLEGIA